MKQTHALQVIVRPLVVGERVTLSGAVNVTGVVEQLDFLQTGCNHSPSPASSSMIASHCMYEAYTPFNTFYSNAVIRTDTHIPYTLPNKVCPCYTASCSFYQMCRTEKMQRLLCLPSNPCLIAPA